MRADYLSDTAACITLSESNLRDLAEGVRRMDGTPLTKTCDLHGNLVRITVYAESDGNHYGDGNRGPGLGYAAEDERDQRIAELERDLDEAERQHSGWMGRAVAAERRAVAAERMLAGIRSQAHDLADYRRDMAEDLRRLADRLAD